MEPEPAPAPPPASIHPWKRLWDEAPARLARQAQDFRTIARCIGQLVEEKTGPITQRLDRRQIERSKCTHPALLGRTLAPRFDQRGSTHDTLSFSLLGQSLSGPPHV